ncbi:hypothetical protein F2Q70_00020608 [Brassica cretica]|uniref:Uncharacterized protein n=1 Tax=Brassica cretica TaxID=69181 RepID=A0A8S9GJ23_BRACR|nr:hypothetical protein F2Q70_00020608 [Brassica cretica]
MDGGYQEDEEVDLVVGKNLDNLVLEDEKDLSVFPCTVFLCYPPVSIQPIPHEDLKKPGIQLPLEGRYMSRTQVYYHFISLSLLIFYLCFVLIHIRYLVHVSCARSGMIDVLFNMS